MESPRRGSRRTTVMQAPDSAMLSPSADVVEVARRRLDRERLAEAAPAPSGFDFDDAADAADDAGEHAAIVAAESAARGVAKASATQAQSAGRRRRASTSTMPKSRLCSSRSNGPNAARPRPLPSRRGAT